jgi:hypothetical protein
MDTADIDVLMALRPAQARVLFPGDRPAISARYKDLAKRWHPDRNRDPRAADVFARLSELHGIALRIVDGVSATQERVFRTRDGRTFRLRWAVRHETDFGEVLVGERHVAHVVPADLDDLSGRAARWTPQFADASMRSEMERFLPHVTAILDTAEARVFVESKTPDQVLLRDLLRAGPVEPRHAAWMTTRLVNLACWLQWAGIAHGALGPDTLLVSPEFHSVAITGPFLCGRSFGRAMDVLPERTLSTAPRYAAAGAVSDARLDPELVRQTIREVLGDPAGTRLAADPDFPKPFANWLLMPAATGAQDDFPSWEQARDASFGPRRFVRWDFDPAAVMAA